MMTQKMQIEPLMRPEVLGSNTHEEFDQHGFLSTRVDRSDHGRALKTQACTWQCLPQTAIEHELLRQAAPEKRCQESRAIVFASLVGCTKASL